MLVFGKCGVCKELAVAMSPFIVSCKSDQTSSRIQAASSAVVDKWKIQRTALKEAKAEAKRLELLRKASLAEKAAAEKAARESCGRESCGRKDRQRKGWCTCHGHSSKENET